MYTLEQLQELGAINGSLRTVDARGALPFQEALGLSDAEQASFDGTIIIDDCKWVATASAMPIANATYVYSSDGERVGAFNRKKRSFYIMQLQGDTLVTNKTFILKEAKRMAEQNLNIDMDQLEADLENASLGVTGTQELDAFDKTGEKKELTERDIKRQEAEKEYAEVRSRLDAVTAGGENICAPDEVIRNNRMYGRLYGFVTATDSTVKLGISTTAKLADGKRIPLQAASEEVKQKAANGEQIPMSQCERECNFAFKQAKPGVIKAMIIGTPAGTELPLTSLGSAHVPNYDLANQDLQIKVLNAETAYAYVGYNYGNIIKESTDVLGEKAEKINFKHVLKRTKGASEPTDKVVLTPANRKKVVIEGNYIPLKVFKTIGVQDPTEEERKILNLNVEATVTRVAPDKKERFSEEARAAYSVGADDTYTSKWFNQGAAIEVPSYEDANVNVANVRIPSRVKKTNAKDPNKFTYSFEYYGMDDAEHGPLSNPTYQQILKAANLPVDEFKKAVESATHKAKSKAAGKGINNTITTEQYLRGLIGRDEHVTNKSLAELQDAIDGLGMLA